MDLGDLQRSGIDWIGELQRGGIDWIDLVQDTNQWWALVKMVMNLLVPQYFGTDWA